MMVLLLVLFSMISNLLSRLSPSRSRCTPTVHNVHNVHNVHCTWHSSPLSSYPPSTESPITNPRPVGPLQRGGQRSLPERKSQKNPKRSTRVYEPFNTIHQRLENWSPSLMASLANSYLSEQKEGGRSNCRIQISCDRFFHLRSHQSNFSGLPSRPPPLPPILLCRLHSWRQRA